MRNSIRATCLLHSAAPSRKSSRDPNLTAYRWRRTASFWLYSPIMHSGRNGRSTNLYAYKRPSFSLGSFQHLGASHPTLLRLVSSSLTNAQKSHHVPPQKNTGHYTYGGNRGDENIICSPTTVPRPKPSCLACYSIRAKSRPFIRKNPHLLGALHKNFFRPYFGAKQSRQRPQTHPFLGGSF